MATYGEGDPTDNAQDFYDWLQENDDEDLSGLNYTVSLYAQVSLCMNIYKNTEMCVACQKQAFSQQVRCFIIGGHVLKVYLVSSIVPVSCESVTELQTYHIQDRSAMMLTVK